LSKLHTAERGSGLPVVLLHGFPFDHTIWQAQIEVLSSEVRVITPDLRGHGQSPILQAGYGIDHMANDIVMLLDDLGIDQAVWVGHSMGGYLTMAALRRSPDRVRAAAFVATHPYADSPEKQQERKNSATKALESGSESVVSGMVKVLFAPGTDLESDTVQRVRSIMVHTPRAGVAGALEAMAERPESVETLRNTRIPMMMIAGAQDQIVTPDMLATLAKQVPHLRLVTIDGAGHMPMIEQPDATTTALREFLQSV
jgi:3-oxoadipate enol-lactonase